MSASPALQRLGGTLHKMKSDLPRKDLNLYLLKCQDGTDLRSPVLSPQKKDLKGGQLSYL